MPDNTIVTKLESLLLAAARLELGVFTAPRPALAERLDLGLQGDFPAVAMDAMSVGLDSPSLLALAIADESEIRWKGEDLLRAALAELSITWPTSEEAIILLNGELGRGFRAGGISLDAFLRDAEALWVAADYEGGEPLGYAASVRDELVGRWGRGREEIEADARDLASEAMERASDITSKLLTERSRP